ncbi:MAG TPA: signal peptidase I [Propionibacteriaceae bacterium]|nr:signal peptidase I [Propionibacteriaceae bacterium]
MSQESGGVGGALKELAIIVVGALVASTLLRLFLLQVFAIPSGSMETTLSVGDRVAVQKVQPFQRGDIVVFRDDLEWLGNPDRFRTPAWKEALVFVGLMPDESERYLVKRVIGTEGDRVACCDAEGRVTVNGAPLDEDPYLHHINGVQVPASRSPFDVVVPAGRLFVMGDNRSNSADSRCHLTDASAGVAGMGAFPRADAVVGTPLATVYPFDRWRAFAVPETFAAVPGAAAPAPAKPVFHEPAGNC